MRQKILIEVSAHHIHLSEKDKDKLFGSGYELNKIKDLSQPGLFAYQETVDLKIDHQKLSHLRVIGPYRPQTQVEISQTESYILKTKIPLRISGDLNQSAGCKIIGPKGEIDLKEGLIIAKRHLHLSLAEAQALNLNENQLVSVEITGERALILKNVIVRISQEYRTALHLDTDEGNAAGIEKIGEGKLII